jgi:mono/diheme cytochrome c family protein
MDQQLYFEAQEPNRLFNGVDGRAMRPPLPNTVAAGSNPYGQSLGIRPGPKEITKIYDEDWLAIDQTYYKGYTASMGRVPGEGKACSDASPCEHSSLTCASGTCRPQACDASTPCSQTDPNVCTDVGGGRTECRPKLYEVNIPPTLAATLRAHNDVNPEDQPFHKFMTRGQERFNIYCAPCHGENGGHPNDMGGSGPIALRAGAKAGIVSYHSEDRIAYPIGRLYDVVTAGKGKMPGFAAQIPPRDRWAIALYVRALQRTQYIEASKFSQNTNP